MEQALKMAYLSGVTPRREIPMAVAAKTTGMSQRKLRQ